MRRKDKHIHRGQHDAGNVAANAGENHPVAQAGCPHFVLNRRSQRTVAEQEQFNGTPTRREFPYDVDQELVILLSLQASDVADDKLVYAYVPTMIRYYLREEPILRNVETMHLLDAKVRADALSRRDELVFKRVDGSGGKGLVIGPTATGTELDELGAMVEAQPRCWIAQHVVALSTSPTWVHSTMGRRHVDLRPFAVHDGEEVWVLPGGLTRVALSEGGLVVNSSQGGGSKDTWVVGGGPAPLILPPRRTLQLNASLPMDAGPGADPDSGREQQQQQQQQPEAGP